MRLAYVKLGLAYNLVYSLALVSALRLATILAKQWEIGKWRKQSKASLTLFSRKMMPAYVKLASAHNLVYSPALVSAPRSAIISAKQRKIILETEIS